MKTLTFSLFQFHFVKCPSSLSRNKAKNALSLARPFSLGFAGQKYKEIGFGKEKNGIFGGLGKQI